MFNRNDARPAGSKEESSAPIERLTDFQQLNVWQKAHKLVIEVFEITKKFPKDERDGMVPLIRRTAMTIPAKIAQGFMRRHPRDKEEAYRQSQDAIEELKYYLILSRDLKLLKDSDEVILGVDEVGRMLTGLVRSVHH
jgi:four helix bundle protein